MGTTSSRRNELKVEADVIIKCFAGHKQDDTFRFYYVGGGESQQLTMKLADDLPVLGLFLTWRADARWHANLRIVEWSPAKVQARVESFRYEWDAIKTVTYCLFWCMKFGNQAFVAHNRSTFQRNGIVDFMRDDFEAFVRSHTLASPKTNSPWDVQMAILSLSDNVVQMSVAATADGSDGWERHAPSSSPPVATPAHPG